jgi:hypothetical protein
MGQKNEQPDPGQVEKAVRGEKPQANRDDARTRRQCDQKKQHAENQNAVAALDALPDDPSGQPNQCGQRQIVGPCEGLPGRRGRIEGAQTKGPDEFFHVERDAPGGNQQVAAHGPHFLAPGHIGRHMGVQCDGNARGGKRKEWQQIDEVLSTPGALLEKITQHQHRRQGHRQRLGEERANPHQKGEPVGATGSARPVAQIEDQRPQIE